MGFVGYLGSLVPPANGSYKEKHLIDIKQHGNRDIHWICRGYINLPLDQVTIALLLLRKDS